MIRVNLLPHRAAFRQQQILEHIIVFVSVVLLAIASVVVINILATEALTTFEVQHAQLRSENAKLTKKIGGLRNLDALRKEVEDKLDIVDELQAGRFRSLNTLYAIASSIPQNIWLDKLDDKGGALTLSGFGESSKAIANFMRALASSKLFDHVQLSVDQSAHKDGIHLRKFALNFKRLSLVEQEAIAARKAAEAAKVAGQQP